MTSQKTLARWILKGLATEKVKETTGGYIVCRDEIYQACALGMAAIGKFGSTKEAHKRFEKRTNLALSGGHLQPIDEFFSELLQISPELTKKIDLIHLTNIPAKEIAALLQEGKL